MWQRPCDEYWTTLGDR